MCIDHYLNLCQPNKYIETKHIPQKKNQQIHQERPRSLWRPGRRINTILFIIAYEKERETRHLQDLALVLPAGLCGGAGVEDGSASHGLAWHCGGEELGKEVVPNRLVKHTLQVALSECGALEILMCADLLGDGQGLLVRDRLHLAGAQGFGSGAVVSQVELGADQDDGDVGGVVFDFREPLLRSVSRIRRQLCRYGESYLGFHVIEGWRADDRETDQEDVGLRV